MDAPNIKNYTTATHFNPKDKVIFKTFEEMMKLPGAVYRDIEKEPDPDFDENYIYCDDHSGRVYLIDTTKRLLLNKVFIVQKVDGPYSWQPFVNFFLEDNENEDLLEFGCNDFHEWWLKHL